MAATCKRAGYCIRYNYYCLVIMFIIIHSFEIFTFNRSYTIVINESILTAS